MEAINYDNIKNEVKTTYSELLEETSKNIFFTETIKNISEAIDNLQISEEKKADSLIAMYGQLANTTVSKTFDQALELVEKSLKIPKEFQMLEKELTIKDKQVAKLDAEIDVTTAQEEELRESILDRQTRRPLEAANLTKQGNLLDKQVAKLEEDKNYVVSQRTSMLEQVQHNKIIKSMDSMGDMIGTLGAGGLVPNPTMFEVYFDMNKALTNIKNPTSYTVTKAT